MKICPNCSKPFEEIAGRLFCQDHGWHALNPDGEIIPADAPTAEQVAAWEAAQKGQPVYKVKDGWKVGKKRKSRKKR